MVTSTDFSGLINERFFRNFLPFPATNTLEIGERTPNFERVDINHGKSIRLSNYRRQQPVVLAFTRIFTENQYCPLCLPHIKALNASYEQFTSLGAEVLLITSTDKHQSEKVVKDLGLKMPLLSDPTCWLFRVYGVGQALGAPLPAQFVLDQQGKLRYRHLFSFLEPNASLETLLKTLEGMTTATQS